jgi:hypothetical protein
MEKSSQEEKEIYLVRKMSKVFKKEINQCIKDRIKNNVLPHAIVFASLMESTRYFFCSYDASLEKDLDVWREFDRIITLLIEEKHKKLKESKH